MMTDGDMFTELLDSVAQEERQLRLDLNKWVQSKIASGSDPIAITAAIHVTSKQMNPNRFADYVAKEIELENRVTHGAQDQKTMSHLSVVSNLNRGGSE